MNTHVHPTRLNEREDKLACLFTYKRPYILEQNTRFAILSA